MGIIALLPMSRKPRREFVAMVDDIVLEVVVVAVDVKVADAEVAAHGAAGAGTKQWWRRGIIDEDDDTSRTNRQ